MRVLFRSVFGLFSDTPHTLEKIYEDAIDVEKHGHGLALQEVAALYLIAPINEQDVHGAENPRITFRWDADVDLLGSDEFETQLFVSALRHGQGLWPDEKWPARNLLLVGDPDTSALADLNQNRTLNTKQMNPSE